MSNSLGKLFTITSFGESHGRVVGIIVDGCPAGLAITEEDIQRELDRRKPGEELVTTARKEADRVEVLSGVFEGRTTGAPICLLAWNRDVDSGDYQRMRYVMRPGHADYTAYVKYGGFNDFRGGGRFSGRITAGLVMAGAIAGKILDIIGVEVMAHTIAVGEHELLIADQSLQALDTPPSLGCVSCINQVDLPLRLLVTARFCIATP